MKILPYDELYEDLKYFFSLDEKFISEYSLESHYEKHVINDNNDKSRPKDLKFGNITKEQYDKIADTLARTPVDYSTILGYVQQKKDASKKLGYVKYNKKDNTLVAYIYDKDDNPIVITCFKRSFRDYESLKYMTKDWEYIDEIPKGK